MSKLQDIGKRIDAAREQIRNLERDHEIELNELNAQLLQLNQQVYAESSRLRGECFASAPHNTLADGTAVYRDYTS